MSLAQLARVRCYLETCQYSVGFNSKVSSVMTDLSLEKCDKHPHMRATPRSCSQVGVNVLVSAFDSGTAFSLFGFGLGWQTCDDTRSCHVSCRFYLFAVGFVFLSFRCLPTESCFEGIEGTAGHLNVARAVRLSYPSGSCVLLKFRFLFCCLLPLLVL